MTPPSPRNGERLRKELGLFDVYAISTGAMFSSGFFLLPGLAAAQTGPSVPLSYLVAGLFILPAMLSVAELSTAMPRAGGAYYFLDRSMGPLVGTIGGLGTWVALVLKSAFALVGMGAYLALYFDVPIRPLAVVLTLVFTAINVVGAKESSGLQRVLVAALMGILGLFIVQGLAAVASAGVDGGARERFTPFFAFGLTGFMGSVGFVFVSYAGLTKVASVSEEIRDPDRNIPLGMMLSLATTAVVYSAGVFILVAVLPPDVLRGDLTPVATAASAVFGWLPAGAGVALIVVAAIAAFASTGNAGILAASRYPLAMARDRLVPTGLEALGRFQTPTRAIAATALLVIASILVLDVASIAKLASAFQLLLFSLLNLAVLIMRESRIEGYDPGFRSPLYPWMQLFGFLSPFWLITEMGAVAVVFSLALVVVTVAWYFYYARSRVVRNGAIFHTFARLGALRYGGLDLELRTIVQEKGLRDEDPFDEVVARAQVVEFRRPTSFEELAGAAAATLAERKVGVVGTLQTALLEALETGFIPVSNGVALPHARLASLERHVLLMARCAGGLRASAREEDAPSLELRGVRAVFFLMSPEAAVGQHLRLLGHLATQAQDDAFMQRWMLALDPPELKATLLRAERWISLSVGEDPMTLAWPTRAIRDVGLPPGTLVAFVRRGGVSIVPNGSTVLEAGDFVTVIGHPTAIRAITSTVDPAVREPA